MHQPVVKPKAYLKSRHKRVREAMKALKLDGLMLTHPPDLAYLSNFTGDDSVGLLTHKDLHLVTERWDDLVARVRATGTSVAATALEHATPTAVNAKGDVTIALDEANPIYERALESTKADVAAVLGEWFPAVQRVVVRAAEGGGPPPARLTDEMVRSERLTSLRRKDPVLDAAIEALDLDLAD